MMEEIDRSGQKFERIQNFLKKYRSYCLFHVVSYRTYMKHADGDIYTLRAGRCFVCSERHSRETCPIYRDMETLRDVCFFCGIPKKISK